MAEFLRFAKEAIETARGVGKKKREHSLRLAELKREGEYDIEDREQTGLSYRARLPKPWFDRRHEELSQQTAEEATLKETGLKEAAATERTTMEWGPEGARMKEADAKQTAAGKLSDVKKAKEQTGIIKVNLEGYDRDANSMLFKLGMITYPDGEQKINSAAYRLFQISKAMAAKNPEEAMRALEFGLESINAEKEDRLEIKNMTDEEKKEKRKRLLQEIQIDEEMAQNSRLQEQRSLEEQFPWLTKPKEIFKERVKKRAKKRLAETKSPKKGTGRGRMRKKTTPTPFHKRDYSERQKSLEAGRIY